MKAKIYNKRLADVRSLMQRKAIDALIIPLSDPHLGEYVPDCWKITEWLTGFTGSAATVIITDRFAGLWTDSRYFLQAEAQLKDTGFVLVRLKIPHTPEYIDWLAVNIPDGGVAAVDGRLISAGQAGVIEKVLKKRNAKLKLKVDLVSGLWKDRPMLPEVAAMEHTSEYAGISRAEKIRQVREIMRSRGADYQLLTASDDVMWLLNIRGGDVKYSPLLLSFAIVGHQQVLLFADEDKIPRTTRAALDTDGVVLLPYDTLCPVLKTLPDGSELILSPATTSAAIHRSVSKKVRITEDISIPTRLKAVKNDTEIKNLREVMVKDGVALTKFFFWLESDINKGHITELSASEKLEKLRLDQEGCTGPSFKTIAAYNDHAALPHYNPTPDTDALLRPEGVFLLDSGGQYFGGTTDTTRTIALSAPDPLMKQDFTLALKGMIDLAMVRFPYGTKGFQIEVLARKALWDHGLNYGHGTGHGVGYFLNVHEGPQTIGTGSSGDMKTILEPGMIISDEPAFYRPGKYGFRTENLILCVESETTEYGRFLRFETLTLCYIDQSLIDFSLLDKRETAWLNEYHTQVYEKISPYLNAVEKKWLSDKVRISD